MRITESFPSCVGIKSRKKWLPFYSVCVSAGAFLLPLRALATVGFVSHPPSVERSVAAPRGCRFPTAQDCRVAPARESVAVHGCARGPSAFSRLSAEALSECVWRYAGRGGGCGSAWGGVAGERGVIRKLCFGYSLSLGLRGASTLKLKGKQPFSLPTAH